MSSRLSIFALVVGGLVGCGAVDSGVCPGELDDGVECTVDFCDINAGAYSHLPDNSRCEAGQVCDPTGGCVAGTAGLKGQATLTGHVDHSGIAVTAEGTSAMATTDANGNYQLTGLASGVYTIQYSKAKYVSESLPNVVVVGDALSLAENVELAHGDEVGENRTIFNVNGVVYSPNKTHMVANVNTNFGYVLYATPLDGSSEPVAIASNVGDYRVTNTHVVFTSNNAVWSRPLTAATPAVRLGSAAPGGNISIAGTPRAYTVMQKYRYTGSYYEYSVWVAKTDGSVAPPSGAAYTTPANYGLQFIQNNDTHALIGISYSNGVSSELNNLHRIDLTTNADTPLPNPGGMASHQASFVSISPDLNYVFGTMRNYNGSYNSYRGFIVAVSGSAPATLAPDYGGASSHYSDVYGCYQYCFTQWTADSSAVVFTTNYNSALGYGGELKFWRVGATTAQVVAGHLAFQNMQVHGRAVIYTEAGNNYLRAVAIESSAANVVLDNSGAGVVQGPYVKIASDNTSAYLVWAQATGAGSGVVSKIMSANLTFPLTAASPVQLGSAIPASCLYEGTMSNTTFYQLCAETGMLTAFTKSTAAPAGQTTGVSPGLIPLPNADRIAFTKSDGFLYSAPNAGTFGANVKLISNKIDLNSPNSNVGDWLIFRDSSSQLTRVSNTDGSGIDEPLVACDVFQGYSPYYENGMSSVWLPAARCGNLFQQVRVPTTNLP